MAEEGQTNFLRSMLLLIEGGSYIAREILNRESNKTGRDIDSLLSDFKTKLKHEFHGKQFEKLFPGIDIKTDINRWDLQLLIGVISIVFRKSITRPEKKNLLVLKQLRNEIFMHCANTFLDEDKYEEVIEQLEDSLNGLASTFENSVKEVCFTFIKDFKSGPLDALRPSTTALNGFPQKIFKVGVSTVLAVGGPSNDWADLCEQILETILNNAITGTESDAYENVRTKVTRMLEFLMENKDVVLTECRRACIVLEFECNSYEDVLYLLNRFDSWEYRYHLNKISNALTKELKVNGLLTITSQVTTESLQSIFIQSLKMLHEDEVSPDCLEISSHVNAEDQEGDNVGEGKTNSNQVSDNVVSVPKDFRKPLKLDLECKSQEGLLHILNTFKGSTLQVHLKDVADALSEHVQNKVTLKTSLNLEDFMSAYEEAVIAERYEDRQLLRYATRPQDFPVDKQELSEETESPVIEEVIEAAKQDSLQDVPVQKQAEYTIILFRGIHPETSCGGLASVIKETTEGIAENENIIFNLTRTCAVVKVLLRQKPDLDIIRRHLRDRCIEDERPDVHEIPPADSIAVSTKEGIDNIDCLQYYFENRKICGYELKQGPYKTEDESCVILQFGDPEIVKKVCARMTPYIWEGKALRVSPCYVFEGELIWDTETHCHSLPKPCTIKLDTDVLKLLQRKCCERLFAKLETNYCVPRFTEEGLELSCSLTTSIAGYRKLADRWSTSAQEIVDNFIKDSITERSFKALEKDWIDITIFFQSEKFEENEEILCRIDEIGYAIHLLGLRQSVEYIHSKLVEKQNQLRHETEVIEFDSPKIRLMRSVGVFEEIRMKMGEIKLEDHEYDVAIRGQSEDVMKAKVKLLEVCSKIEKRKLKHDLSKECVEFIQGKLKEILTSSLKARYTSNFVEWDIDYRDISVYVYTFEQNKTEQLVEKHRIDEEHNYATETVYTTPEEILKESVWEIQENTPAPCDHVNMKSFLKDINDRYGDHVIVQYIDAQEKLTICGLKDEAIMVHGKVKEFLEKKGAHVIERVIERDTGYVNFIRKLKKDQLRRLEKENAVNIDSGDKRLIITGPEEGVMKTEDTLKAMFDKIICEKLDVQKVGVKAAFRDPEKKRQLSLAGEMKRCIIQLPDDEQQEAHWMTETSKETIDSSEEFEVIDSSEEVKGSVCGPQFIQEVSWESDSDIPKERDDTFKTPNGIEVKLVKGELGQQEGDVIVAGTSFNLNLKCGKACKSLLDKGGNTLQEACSRSYPSGIQSKEIAVIKACENVACKHVYLTALPNWTTDSETRSLFKFIMNKALELASKDGMTSIVFSALGTGQLGYPKDFVAFLMYDAVMTFDRSHPQTTLKDVRFVLYPKDDATIKAFEEEERIRKENSVRRRIVYDLKASKMTIQVCFGDITDQNQTYNVKDDLFKVLNKASLKGLASLDIPASLRDDQVSEVKEDVCTTLFHTVIEWAKDNQRSTLKTVKFIIDPADSKASHRFRSYVLNAKGIGKRLHRSPHDDQDDVQTDLAIGKINLRLKMGNILNQMTDAIVSSVGKDFQLIGSVAYTLKSKWPGLEREIQCRDLVRKLNTENVVVTEVDKPVIHIRFADNLKDWQDRIRKCLELANEKSYRSVSFPVLGTGKGFKTFSPEEITGCLLKALRDFEQTHPSPSLQDVYLIVYEKQPEMYKLIKKMLQASSLETQDEITVDENRIASRLKTLRQFSGKGAEPTQDYNVPAKLWKTLVKETSSMEVSIYSDETDDIMRCKKLLKDEIDEMYIERKLENYKETVKSLTLKQVKEIDMIALANISIDHRSGIISLYGPKEDVLDVSNEIQTKLLKIGDMKSELDAADKLFHLIQWKYEEVTATGFSFVPYKRLWNYRIEQAYKANLRYFEIEENDESFLVDLQHFEEYRKSDVTDRIRVMRKNILEEKYVSSRQPWTKWTREEVEASFLSEENSFEYKNIFRMNNISIIKVAEISETQYHQLYQARKRQMLEQPSKSRKSGNVERDLWYAASYDEVSDILEHGFNNSFCRRVAPLHGEGVYFTSDAVHSIRRWLSSACSGGKGYMFVANVLTGHVCKGQRGTRFLPEVDSFKTKCQYESAVDDLEDPSEFVVFNDTQACPRYLITFQYTGE